MGRKGTKSKMARRNLVFVANHVLEKSGAKASNCFVNVRKKNIHRPTKAIPSPMSKQRRRKGKHQQRMRNKLRNY